MTRHIRIQKEILAGKFSKERKTKLKNRNNEFFERVTLLDGRKVTRRKGKVF